MFTWWFHCSARPINVTTIAAQCNFNFNCRQILRSQCKKLLSLRVVNLDRQLQMTLKNGHNAATETHAVAQEYLRRQRIFRLFHKQKWVCLQCTPPEIRPETHAFFSPGSGWRDVLWDHFKQPCYMRYLPYFSSHLNCHLHHRWKNRSVLLAAVKATLKPANFADHVKNKHLMICPQRDSFQLFWQHLKKEDAMLSSLCLCLEIILILCCYTVTMAHLNFKVCSSQGKFPEWLSQKAVKRYEFFFLFAQ